MTKCPDCHAVYEGLVGHCSRCGYQFASDPRANVRTRRYFSLAQVRLGCLGVIGIAVALIAFRSYDEPQQISSNGPGPGSVCTITSQPQYSPPVRSGTAAIGEMATVVEGHGFWPCGATTAAYDELMKWTARGDIAEVRRTLNRTRSIGLVGGMQVKVLDAGFGRRKVRVLTNSTGQSRLSDEQGEFSADPRIGHECWVVSEALGK